MSSESDFKSLAKTISNTANTAQLFYLLVRIGEHEDDLVKSRCAASCKRLQSNIIDLTTMLQGDLELKKARAELIAKTQSLIDSCAPASGKSPAKPSAVDATESAAQMIEKKLDADARRLKCSHALEEAKAELERLKQLSE